MGVYEINVKGFIYQHNYKTFGNVDTKKNLNELIEENIAFKPEKDQEIIENQIILDQLIYEKYKGKEIKLTDNSKFLLIEERYPCFIKFVNKIYTDESLNYHSHKLLNYYYSQKSASDKKIKFCFNLDKDIFLKVNKNNKDIILRTLFGKIISEINSSTKIPKEIMYITNIREAGFISFDLFLFDKDKMIKINPQLKTYIENLFNEKTIFYLKNVLKESLNKIGNTRFEVENIEIQRIISNYFISPSILKPILYPNTNNYPKTNFKIIKKIDKTKNLKELISEYITPESFKNPKNETTFIENQILLDQIIYEKYKDKQINFNDNIYRDGGAMEALLLYFKNKKYKVYIDESIDKDLFKEINKYYFNQNALGKKFRLSLDIDGSIINDQDKLRYKIINPVISKIEELTKIPKEKIFVTNVRNNCIICDIFIYLKNLFCPDKNMVEELLRFLSEIQNNLENNPNNLYQSMENRVEIHDIIENYVVNPWHYFNREFNKPKGSFGIRLFIFHVESQMKNGKTYFYPGEQWEGFGLNVDVSNNSLPVNDIFDKNGDWCIAYCDLLKRQKCYKIKDIVKETLYDNQNRRYSLLFQCKIKKDRIWSDEEKNIVMFDDRYVIPYRLLRENIAD